MKVRDIFLAALFLAAAGGALAEVPGRVCAEPRGSCPGFRANDLPFVLSEKPLARSEERSLGFYAVILRSVPRCTLAEVERLRLQELFPRRKVFATHFECDGDPENNVTYSGVDATRGFVAVYAGEDRATAQEMLEVVRGTARFPGANLRLMQVILVHP